MFYSKLGRLKKSNDVFINDGRYIFLDTVAGKDSNDGLSYNKPKKTWTVVQALLNSTNAYPYICIIKKGSKISTTGGTIKLTNTAPKTVIVMSEPGITDYNNMPTFTATASHVVNGSSTGKKYFIGLNLNPSGSTASGGAAAYACPLYSTLNSCFINCAIKISSSGCLINTVTNTTKFYNCHFLGTVKNTMIAVYATDTTLFYGYRCYVQNNAASRTDSTNYVRLYDSVLPTVVTYSPYRSFTGNVIGSYSLPSNGKVVLPVSHSTCGVFGGTFSIDTDLGDSSVLPQTWLDVLDSNFAGY